MAAVERRRPRGAAAVLVVATAHTIAALTERAPHGPRAHHPLDLQVQVEVVGARLMPLDDEQPRAHATDRELLMTLDTARWLATTSPRNAISSCTASGGPRRGSLLSPGPKPMTDGSGALAATASASVPPRAAARSARFRPGDAIAPSVTVPANSPLSRLPQRNSAAGARHEPPQCRDAGKLDGAGGAAAVVPPRQKGRVPRVGEGPARTHVCDP